MTVKEAIEALKTYPEDAEIQMYCTHDGKIENSLIREYGYNNTNSCTFWPNRSVRPKDSNDKFTFNINPYIHCSS